MFDFPGTPTNGQMFTPVAGGPSYVFQSPVWRLAAGGVNPGFWIGDAPPSSPVQGTLWWESDSGNSYIWYDDGSSAQWVQFNIAPPSADTSVLLPEQAAAPATLANFGAVYTKDAAAKSELFFRTDASGAEAQLTKSGRPAIWASGQLANSGAAFKDWAIPSDFDTLDVAGIAFINNTAATFIYAQLLTGGAGNPGDPLVGGTPIAGASYVGTLSAITNAASSSVWANNIPLTGSSAINTSASGRLRLRYAPNTWWQVDSQFAYTNGAGTLLSTGYLTGGPFTGIRIGVTGGLMSSGVIRLIAH